MWKCALANPIVGEPNCAGTAEHKYGVRHMAESKLRNVGEDERLDCSPCTPVASDVAIARTKIGVDKACRMDKEACLFRMERAQWARCQVCGDPLLIEVLVVLTQRAISR